MPGLAAKSSVETPRLKLRGMVEADAPAIAAGVGPFAVSRWLTSVPHPYRLQDAQAFIAFAAGRPFVRGIEFEGWLVGTLSIGSELGYWLAQEAWGRGIATEAGQAALAWYFADPCNDALAASHFVENAASANVLRKLGFRYTGDRLALDSLSLGRTVTSRAMILTRTAWTNRHPWA